MRKLLAIAGLTVRAALRSRLILSLALLLLAIMTLLPLTIKGDGTPAGHARILLGYTLGSAHFLLSLAALWAGCAAVAVEVETRRIHLVVAKPVGAGTLWLGKWLGLLALNAVWLGLAGALAYGGLRWTLRPARLAPDDRRVVAREVLVSRQALRPRLPDVRAGARAALERLRRVGELPVGVSEAEALQTLQRDVLIDFYSVPPGGRRTWEIRAPFAPAAAQPVFLQFRFDIATLTPDAVAGRWLVFMDGAASPVFTAEGRYPPQAQHTLEIPPGRLVRRGVVRVEFQHLGEPAAQVFFKTQRGVELLAQRGTFVANFGRALLTLFVLLAFYSALGLTAGAIFSLPVAGFLSFALLIMILLAGFVEQMAGEPGILPHLDTGGALWRGLDAAIRMFYRGLHVALRVFQGESPLDPLAEGRAVPWSDVGRRFLLQGLLYSGLLGWGGAAVFRRRELGNV